MRNNSLTVEQVLTLLAETPMRLTALTNTLSSEQLQAVSGQDEWSVNEILAHLRSCADVWGGCIQRILTEDTPTIRAIHPSAWIKQTDYPGLDFRTSLHAFTAQRAALLATLGPLPPTDWSRTATVTGAGKVLERDLLFYARWMASHERTHIKQIERFVKMLSNPRPHRNHQSERSIFLIDTNIGGLRMR